MTETLRVLSFGAGVQSTTLLMLAVHGEAPRPDAVVFADTGWEPAAVYKHLAWCRSQCEHAGLPFHVATYENLRIRVEEALASRATFINLPLFVRNSQSGERGILRRQCTDRFKIAPIRRKMRELLAETGGSRVELMLGISLDEVMRDEALAGAVGDTHVSARRPEIHAAGVSRVDEGARLPDATSIRLYWLPVPFGRLLAEDA